MNFAHVQAFAHFMERSPCMAWIYDKDGRYIYANKKFCHFNHHDDLTGKTLFDIFNHKDAARFKQKLDVVLSTSSGVDYVEDVMDSGKLYKFLIHKFPLELNGQTVVGGTALDITAHLKLQDELAYHSYILDNIDTAVVGVDLDKKVFYWNRFATELYGWSREETLGKPLPVLTLRTPEVRQQVSTVWQTLNQGQTWRGEFTAVAKNGRQFPAFVVNTPIIDQVTKQIKGVVGIASDITQVKLLEETLNHKKRVLQEIAFMQSHELRRPVANILGLIPLISDIEVNEPARATLKLLHTSITELDRLIKDIVDKSADNKANTPPAT
jgi:PAS domain S-box-containing protein